MQGQRPQRILGTQDRIDAAVHAAREYSGHRTDAVLRVFVSSDLLPDGRDPDSWVQKETDRLRSSKARRHDVEIIVLDTKESFTHARMVGTAADPTDDRPGAATGGPRGLTQPQPPSPDVVVRFLEPHDAKRPLVFRTLMLLGRADEDGVVGVGDERVSRRHLSLRSGNGTLVATDLGSKNGTLVNQAPLPAYGKQILEAGDVIQIGEVRLRVDATGA